MCYKMLFCVSFILFLFINYSVQGQTAADLNATLATTNSETNKSTVSFCDGDYIDPPNCTICATNYETKDGKCSKIKSELKPSLSAGRRVFFILLACLLTIILIASMILVYRHLNQERRRHSLSNPRNISDSSNPDTNIPNRFNNILRSIGLSNLNKRRPFNFFSISNNNNNSSSGQYQQTDSSRAPLNENPDEALLADDPYADGGFNSASANPYKSLTLAIT